MWKMYTPKTPKQALKKQEMEPKCILPQNKNSEPLAQLCTHLHPSYAAATVYPTGKRFLCQLVKNDYLCKCELSAYNGRQRRKTIKYKQFNN